MDNKFEGKKLLILGANPETIPLIEVANSLGIKTIVTSNRENDPAKKHAWRSFNVDGMDVPGLVSLARNEGVDGVLVGVADSLIAPYCKVCDALELPCYATQEIVDTFTYKDLFKSTCERYGIHGIPEYYLDETLNKADIDKIVFPVMVKPVDSYSGLGMTVVYEKADLKNAVELAIATSKKKRFIVERYMDCEDVGIYYTFKDGKCYLSCIYDRNTTDKQPGLSRVNMGSIYPSVHIDDYYARMHNNAIRMFKEIGIKNGVLLISAFYENGEFYVYDPGFRLQGEAPHLLINAINGFDQRKMLISYALSGSEGNINLSELNDPMFRGKCAATLWILLRSGRINRIVGLDKIDEDERVVANIQRFYENDIVEEEWVGTEKQVMTRLYFVCNSKKELYEAVSFYMDEIKVYDESDNNMIVSWLDPKVIL